MIGNSLTVLRSEWVGKTPLNHALGNHRSYRGRFSVRVREEQLGLGDREVALRQWRTTERS